MFSSHPKSSCVGHVLDSVQELPELVTLKQRQAHADKPRIAMVSTRQKSGPNFFDKVQRGLEVGKHLLPQLDIQELPHLRRHRDHRSFHISNANRAFPGIESR